MTEEEKIETIFREKANELKQNPKGLKLDNNQKLKFYGLYKVATVGSYNEENKLKAGFFDFETKYKNEAWQKCSVYSKREAMLEYIKYYCELSGEKINFNFSEKNISIKDLSLDIPEDFGSSSLYSSNMKEKKEEMEKFYQNAKEDEKKFQKLKDDLYSGEIITVDILDAFEKENQINCIFFFLFFSSYF